jgi:serine protease DegQ
MVLDGIVQDGQVTRGWIGVEPNELTPELAQTFGVEASQGVIITGVLQNGPAAKGGMKPGDVVSAVSGADSAQCGGTAWRRRRTQTRHGGKL